MVISGRKLLRPFVTNPFRLRLRGLARKGLQHIGPEEAVTNEEMQLVLKLREGYLDGTFSNKSPAASPPRRGLAVPNISAVYAGSKQ